MPRRTEKIQSEVAQKEVDYLCLDKVALLVPNAFKIIKDNATESVYIRVLVVSVEALTMLLSGHENWLVRQQHAPAVKR